MGPIDSPPEGSGWGVSAPPVWMRGCEGRNSTKCSATAIGPIPGPPPAVGDAKGLVQIQMAHVNADFPGPTQSHQGIHVGTVHIDLTARLVDDRADFADGLFKHPVGRGVGHHQSRQPLAVCGSFRPQIRQVDIALAGHRRRPPRPTQP